MIENYDSTFKQINLLGKVDLKVEEKEVPLNIPTLTTTIPSSKYDSSTGYYKWELYGADYQTSSYFYFKINMNVDEPTELCFSVQCSRTSSSYNKYVRIYFSELDKSLRQETYTYDTEPIKFFWETTSYSSSPSKVTYGVIPKGTHSITVKCTSAGQHNSSSYINTVRLKILTPYGNELKNVQVIESSNNTLTTSQENRLIYNSEEIANQKDVDITLNSATITRYEEESANV